jgi:hypothetical protein
MITKRFRHVLLTGAIVSASMLGAAQSAAQPSPSGCTQQSIANCRYWDELGYDSYGDCRLAEYDICMAGGGLAQLTWGRRSDVRV